MREDRGGALDRAHLSARHRQRSASVEENYGELMTPLLENTPALGQNTVPEHVKRRQTAAAAAPVGFRRGGRAEGAVVMLRFEGGVAVVTQQRLRFLPVFPG